MISVLYVGNWLPLLDNTCRFLERKGDVTVESSRSTGEALQKMGHLSFDVVINDCDLEESAGIDLLRQIRQKGVSTPFIFFTDGSCYGGEREAAQYGQVSFVPKLCHSGPGFGELENQIRSLVPVSHPGSTNLQKDSICLVREEFP